MPSTQLLELRTGLMRCFEWSKGKYSNQVTEVTGEVRGEELTVSVEAQVCGNCGSQVMTDDQSSAYTGAIADAYRDKHGLLTSSRLKQIRNRLGMSQRTLPTSFAWARRA